MDLLKGSRQQAANIDSVKCAALTCRYTLEEFSGKLRRFEPSLGHFPTGDAFTKAGRKVQWAWFRKDQVTQLRNYLNIHIGTINLMLMSQGVIMLDVAADQSEDNNLNLQQRMDASIDALQKARRDAQANGSIVANNQSMLKRLLGLVSSDVLAQLKALQELVAKVW